MKLFLKITLGVLVLGGVIVGAALYFTSGSRETARSFLLNLSSGAYEEARAVMHPQLASQFPVETLTDAMGGLEAFSEVSFSGFQASGGSTSYNGTATTASGCTSIVELELVKEQVISFNIKPPCPKP